MLSGRPAGPTASGCTWIAFLYALVVRACLTNLSHALQAEVIAFQEECSKDLEAAEPIIAQAEAALNSLDKASLGELKSFGSPAAEVVAVVSAVMCLAAPGGKIPKVRAVVRKQSVWMACAAARNQRAQQLIEGLVVPCIEAAVLWYTVPVCTG